MTRIERECCDKCLFHHLDDPISSTRITTTTTNNMSYLSDVNDRKLILKKKWWYLFRLLSLNFFLLEHISQELDSNTVKLLLENQLKYPSRLLSCQLELSFAFTFIHLPTGGNGRKSNDVRLIGIVIPIAVKTRHSSKDDDREDLLLMLKSRILKKKNDRRFNITREVYL